MTTRRAFSGALAGGLPAVALIAEAQQQAKTDRGRSRQAEGLGYCFGPITSSNGIAP